jgi:hypothetical protein|tara:strand:- start:16257 stop:16511 length:255 start_codon:yes stop_codon:yes gene_type:complete
MATIIARTIRGKDTTEAAMADATQVNTISAPNMNRDNCPMGASLPTIMSKKYPVTTGGKANGKEIKVSKINFPFMFFRPMSQPT